MKRTGTLKLCHYFAFKRVGAWLIHHLGNVPLDNKELMDMQHEYLTNKTNKKILANHVKYVLKTSSKRVFCIPWSFMLPLLLRDIICFYKAYFTRLFDHHNHNSTATETLKIFHIWTIEQFMLVGTSRKHIFQILLETDVIGWGCPRLCQVMSTSKNKYTTTSLDNLFQSLTTFHVIFFLIYIFRISDYFMLLNLLTCLAPSLFCPAITKHTALHLWKLGHLYCKYKYKSVSIQYHGIDAIWLSLTSLVLGVTDLWLHLLWPKCASLNSHAISVSAVRSLMVSDIVYLSATFCYVAVDLSHNI